MNEKYYRTLIFLHIVRKVLLSLSCALEEVDPHSFGPRYTRKELERDTVVVPRAFVVGAHGGCRTEFGANTVRCESRPRRRRTSDRRVYFGCTIRVDLPSGVGVSVRRSRFHGIKRQALVVNGLLFSLDDSSPRFRFDQSTTGSSAMIAS